MAKFYNAETKEPLSTLYISSSRKADFVLSAPEVPIDESKPSMLAMRKPEPKPEVSLRIAQGGTGRVEKDFGRNPKRGDYRWQIYDLLPGTVVEAVDTGGKVIATIPVKIISDCASYKPIMKRFNSRGMKVDLDSHIAYVCYASDIVGEGISFVPKSSTEFKLAITDTQLFHHDDRSDPFGKAAASATIGEGYREVSTPSLHVAIAQEISSVHIDSYAFQITSPNGNIVITPDMGQHIFDELLFRMPMTWLRRKNVPFLASVLQALHPVLPNSANGYTPAMGLRVEIGGSDARDIKTDNATFTFESTYNVGFQKDRRWEHTATLKLAAGGNDKTRPDWILSLKGKASCSDALCNDLQTNVGVFFTANEH